MFNLILISRNKEETESYLNDFLKKEKILKKDCFTFLPRENGWTVDEIEEIVRLSQFEFSQKTVFLLYDFNTAKELQQNLLLKTLEEHQKNLLFFLVVASLTNILPTIRSRCETARTVAQMKPLTKIEEDLQTEVKRILEKAEKKELVLLSQELKLTPAKKKEQALAFLDSFLKVMSDKLTKDKQNVETTNVIRRALQARKYISTNYFDPELALDQIFLLT